MPAKVQFYTFSQLEQLWINNGGDRASAPIMAAIALAESSGNPTATNQNSNGTVDRGLWQINSVHGSLSTFDVNANAKAAVSIKRQQGLKAWVTYTTGAYRKFLSGAAPDPNLPSGSTSTAEQAGLLGGGDIAGAIGEGVGAGIAALFEPVISTAIWGGELLLGVILMTLAVGVFVMGTNTGRNLAAGAANVIGSAAIPEARIPIALSERRSRLAHSERRIRGNRESGNS